MKLSHYDYHPIQWNPDHAYDVSQRGGYGKPHGFWVSVDGEDDWAEWCLREGFCPEALAARHEVILASDANVAMITTPQGINEFHATYAYEDEVSLHMRDSGRLSPEYLNNQWKIHWPTVAQDYDGVIIAPYQWTLRLGGPHWYYGWDCASGVIWRTGAIASVTHKPLLALEAA